jgi:hypothetical protein
MAIRDVTVEMSDSRTLAVRIPDGMGTAVVSEPPG